ncbi:MAG: DUF488 domain-containing protein [Propionibacterium sp.]|jgi:uncharacterized protein (DUF488 family)|nr:DUF488 domain-containing protein [Propionibacterium sp.]
MPFGQDTLAGSSGCLVPARAINGLMGSPRLISIGYEGRDVDELVTQLLAQSVTTLVDVRLTPISRKRGMSKTALREALNAAGIRYVHHRELGNPKDNRDGYRHGYQSAYDRFGEVLQGPAAGRALKHVSELLDGGRVALLCYERDHSRCHRAMVSDALREIEPDLLVSKI